MMSKFGNRRGQTIILLTVGLTVMIGIVGLTVDVGWSYFREQTAQAAAEAAAMGAVKYALDNSSGTVTCGSNGATCQSATLCPDPIPSPPTSSFDAGCLYAKDNGYTTTSSTNAKVYLAANTTSSPINGLSTQYWATATVGSVEKHGFSAVLGYLSGMVSAKATAVILPGSNYGCIYVLDPLASDSLDVSGTTQVTAPCGVYVDSNSPTALQVKGANATLNASPGSINVVGNDTGSNGAISPNAMVNSSYVSDPLANVSAPSWTGCDHATQVNIAGGIVALSPGVYCGGIAISGISTVTFTPGTYILNGGGLTISGSNTIVTGAGVTFYNTADAAHTFAPFNITGGTTLDLAAPLTGSLANVLFFQDRAITSSSTNTIAGGSTSVFTGVLYFKNSPVLFSGNSVSSNVSIVADKVTFTGASRIIGSASGGSSYNGASGRVGIVE
jgi:hypothetical protein